jgi:hypothetical protein
MNVFILQDDRGSLLIVVEHEARSLKQNDGG